MEKAKCLEDLWAADAKGKRIMFKEKVFYKSILHMCHPSCLVQIKAINFISSLFEQFIILSSYSVQIIPNHLLLFHTAYSFFPSTGHT